MKKRKKRKKKNKETYHIRFLYLVFLWWKEHSEETVHALDGEK